MSETTKLYYKVCRESAGMTQEEAILYLNLADVSTLSKYENGHLTPDQQTVATMVTLYRTPSLALWHIRHVNSALAHFLPEITELKSEGDAYLQGALAGDLLDRCMEAFKRTMNDNADTSNNLDVGNINKDLKKVLNKTMSIITYIDDKMQG